MWLYIIIAIIVILIIYALILYNVFVRLDNKVKEAFSTMDVYLKKRWDLIPSLVETVKGYANYEKETLVELSKIRNSSYDVLSYKDKIKTNELLSKNINILFGLIESYPELKANEQFKELSTQLIKIEDDIANSRKYYNGSVRLYNSKVEIFPCNIFAKLFGFKSKEMFEANANERENISVKL